jgi:hypothetical protein
MKKLIYATVFFSSLFLITSCSKTTPEACVTTTTAANAYTTEGYPQFSVNTSVTFDASCSKDGLTYQWEFGDGSKKTKKK